MRRYDAVAIGSGINSLVAGALLAQRGLEGLRARAERLARRRDPHGRDHRAGLRARGVRVVASALHRLGRVRASCSDELEARGLEYLNTELPTATLFPDGESRLPDHLARARTSPRSGRRGSGPSRSSCRTPTSRSACSAPSSGRATARSSAGRRYRRLGRRGARRVHRQRARLRAATGLRETFEDERARGCFAPVGAAHRARAGRGLVRVHGAGDRRRDRARRDAGAARRRRQARRGARGDHPGRGRRVRDRAGGRARARASGGRATGVRTADGETIEASARRARERDAAGALRRGCSAQARARRERFRYGRGEMQIHFALSEPPRWDGDERLGRTAIVHLTPGPRRRLAGGERGGPRAAARRGDGRRRPADGRRSVARARGRLDPLDPAPGVPSRPKGDAAGELDTGDGDWTEELREAYADRIQARIAAHAPGFDVARSCGASCSRRRTSRPRTRTCPAATSTPARARSTRTSSGGRGPGLPGHRTQSTALAHRRVHAPRPGSARARSSRRRCSSDPPAPTRRHGRVLRRGGRLLPRRTRDGGARGVVVAGRRQRDPPGRGPRDARDHRPEERRVHRRGRGRSPGRGPSRVALEVDDARAATWPSRPAPTSLPSRRRHRGAR